jgi:hypothetical protein
MLDLHYLEVGLDLDGSDLDVRLLRLLGCVLGSLARIHVGGL